jgi:hypothetical protein
MEDPAEQLIRRALGGRRPPQLGPTLADDVLRRVAPRPLATAGRTAARRWLAGTIWLAVVGASLAVLAHLGSATETTAVAWGIALAMVPLAYSATLWPERALVLLALCGGPLVGEPRGEPQVVVPRAPSRRQGQRPA